MIPRFVIPDSSRLRRAVLALTLAVMAAGCARSAPRPAWEAENPLQPLPKAPLGVGIDLASLPTPPTPETVRLGRWLFYDTRLSADGTISCGTCHRPEHAFSETAPVSTGIHGQKGTRKSPSFVNQAVTLYPFFFWDGRASSLEDQALGPVANPIEMGSSHESMVATVGAIAAYTPYFREAFGTDAITKERIVRAIADYERTRMSGNSPWDRWRRTRDDDAVPELAKTGHDLFFGRAACNQCHLGDNFTDSRFHNLGVGYDPATNTFKDAGRGGISKAPADLGAFKTPTLRDVARHPPYMHDGSQATLREVVEHYDKGGVKNPHLDPKITPIGLTPAEIDALVAFMEALNGEGFMDSPPRTFPR